MKVQQTKPTELAWLLDVTDSRQPLSELCPVWVRHGIIHSGPPVPHPEQHPYCEFGTTLEGVVISYVEQEQAKRLPGDMFLAGPGVPHWASIANYPLHFVTVYFLPSVLTEMGPERDGPRVLRRFTRRQSLAQRLLRPPPELRARLFTLFETLVDEFEGNRFGRELRLRTLLVEQLVALLRWEQSRGLHALGNEPDFEWRPIAKALQYLREHFTEPIYAHHVARAAGVSPSCLRAHFRKAIGMSWVRYLQSCRIHRVTVLLNHPGARVTEAALAAGFDSLSHFNAAFRSFMGVAPTAYQRRIGAK